MHHNQVHQKHEPVIVATLTIYLKDGTSRSVTDFWESLLSRIKRARNEPEFSAYSITDAREV